ncbi:protein-glutamate O-methyltransferase CheR [bacterium]|nr:protein-glutamate O-methyltransferase CheR [bacterium]
MGRILIGSSNNMRANEHTLSDKDFKFICKFVYDTTGIVLEERKREMVYRRLMRRTRDLGIPSFNAYCDLLRNNDRDEVPKFINAITTNLTSFFRENHHFEFLTHNFIPTLISDASNRRLRIWSAGCSTGEEPYSIAMTLKNAMGSQLSQWDAKILATDLDTDVLQKGKNGIYKVSSTTGIEQSIFKRWFKKGSQNNEGMAKVSPELKELITFKQLNLLQEWPMRGPFDIIFCRNVVIYFDKPTQQQLFDRYYELLAPGGYLILGHSEGLGSKQHLFNAIGKTIFQKPMQ